MIADLLAVLVGFAASALVALVMWLQWVTA